MSRFSEAMRTIGRQTGPVSRRIVGRRFLAAGGCTITWRGRDHQADAPVLIGPSEAAPAFSGWQRAVIRLTGIKSFLRLRRL